MPLSPNPHTPEFTPARVFAEIDSFDSYMQDERKSLRLHKALYDTRFWDFANGPGTGRTTNMANAGNYAGNRTPYIEVNEMNVVVNAYVAALHKATQRVSCTPDLLGRGDPEKWEAVLNAWLGLKAQKERIVRAFRQAEVWAGCGLKIATVSGTAPAHERVQLRVVPWWEVMLDRDVSDEADERFRGHIYWTPKAALLRRYPKLVHRNIVGQPRVDFLAPGGSDVANNPSAVQRKKTAPQDTPAPGTAKNAAESDCVRVCEFYNLTDTITIDGVEYQGRLEVYLVGQDESFREPIHVDALPFANASGAPLPNIVPVIFDYELEFPYHGIAPTTRMVPQMVEKNLVRTGMARSIRLNARKGIIRPGALGSNQNDVLMNGDDMAFALAAAGFDKPLSDAVWMVPNHDMASDVFRYNEILTADGQATKATPPSTEGRFGKAGTTAYEVQTAALAHENAVAIHAGIFLSAFEDALRLVICGIILNLTQVADSAGGNDGAVTLGADTARPATTEDVTPEAQAVDAQAAAAAQAEGAVAPLRVTAAPGVAEVSRGRVVMTQDVLRIQKGKETLTVTVDDLDGEVQIQFVEGIRTPMTDAAKQQTLMAIQEPYMKLWEMVVKGGPMGILAEKFMRAMHDRFDLPDDLSVDNLRATYQQQQEREAAQTPPAPKPDALQRAATPPMPPPAEQPEAPVEPPPSPGGGLRAELARAAQMAQTGDGSGALDVLHRLFADMPEIRQVVEQALQSPDEADRATAALQIVGMTAQAAGMVPAEAPPAEPEVNDAAV